MSVRWALRIPVLLAWLAAWPAAAQEAAEEAGAPRFELRLRGGICGLTGGYAPNLSIGPTWGVSVGFRLIKWLGLEAGYEGSYNNLQNSHGSLLRQGGQALGKLLATAGPVDPYLGAGFGVSFYQGTSVGAEVIDDQTVSEIPLVLGVDWRSGLLAIGGRASFTLLLNDEFARSIAPEAGGGIAAFNVLIGLGF
jgi:hypothetical protein